MHPRTMAAMSHRQLSFLASLIALLALAALLPSLVRLLPVGSPGVSAQPDLSRRPLSFEPNVGQAVSTTRYVAHAPGGTLYFGPSEVVLSLDGGDKAQTVAANMAFLGASPAARISENAPLPGMANYCLGSDPARWRTNVPTFSGIIYNDPYNGVSLSYEGGGGRLKGTYTLAPNADPAQIRWAYSGADKIQTLATRSFIELCAKRRPVPSGMGRMLRCVLRPRARPPFVG